MRSSSPGNDGAVVGEALVGVHHAGEINTGGIVVDECRVSCLRQDNGEGSAGQSHLRTLPRGLPQRRGGGGFLRELLGQILGSFTADNVGVLGRVDPAHNLRG